MLHNKNKRFLAISAPVLLLTAQAGFAQDAQSRATSAAPAQSLSRANHPAVGSWFGKAVQLCADPTNTTTCLQLTILMTPMMTADGEFTGVDSTAIGGPPLGPHTAAFGQWYPINSTAVVADYVFMANPTPAPAVIGSSMAVSRFRWESQAIDSQTMVGYINFYPFPAVPVAWQNITDPTVFPTLPPETAGPLTTPLGMVTDPKTCTTQGCPLVFKFTVKRVTPLASVFGN